MPRFVQHYGTTAYKDIDLGTFSAYLSLPRDGVLKEHALLPADA